ncbi:hypothetical protein EUGRSUZ_I00814 [Eucalyptus grandis]|uniref:Uncharacterized protein n=2 Tax=Eucalyptus grandis TaxID=71139 RepID=A0ACC3JD95_EUCGR|nr:hypothetical protein EUGRSUZ_I00814 [Eucalyptus grandis]
MAAVHSKELFLGWYLLTLKLRKILESRLPSKSTYAGEIVPDYEPRPSKCEWVISIDEKLSIEEKLARGRQDNVPGSWANLSIYRIPRYLKRGEDKAWVPQIVSLGPYHHGDEHLRHMEQHKWRCLHRILERSGQGIGLYLDSVKKVKRRACACYEGRISMSGDEFMEMMVLDGCFVIEMFQGFTEGFEKLGYLPNDPVFSMRGSILQIQRDMIMLENQIPLFILDRLLGLQLGDPNQKERVTKLALQFFSPLIGVPQTIGFGGHVMVETVHPIDKDSYKRLKFDPFCDHGKVHCLEVVRRSLLHLGLKRPKTEKWPHSRKRLTFCLSELREAGIQIKWRPRNSWGNIHFKNGILGIPPIEIHEGTRSLFLNLIAFEQSHFNCSHYVTSYVIFMNNLINSPEDVLYLRNRRIIHHCLGSDAEVADLFHQLCQEVAFDPEDSYLRDIYKELSEYCHFGFIPSDVYKDPPDTCCVAIKFIVAVLWGISRAFLTRKWNAWKAILKNKYFDSPWSIISLIAAFILLVLTCIQSFYAVYSYYRPRS